MKDTELVVSVDGFEEKIPVKMMYEVFDEKDGTKTIEWKSGRKEIQDRFKGDRWCHKKVYGMDGTLDSEVTRVFDEEGRLVSICTDRADGSRNSMIYEYDGKGQIIRQKNEVMGKDGSTRMLERCYKNFYDDEGDRPDFGSFRFDGKKDLCYREFDSTGRCIRFMDSNIEGNTEYLDDGGSVFTVNGGGTISRRNIYRKSDDGLVEIHRCEILEDKKSWCSYKDMRRSAENPERLYAVYVSCEEG